MSADATNASGGSSFGLVRRWLIRVVMLAGAVFLALVISGAIFQIVPGVTIAHSRGISMEPAYQDGDVVLLHVRQPSSVKVGEVVLFHDGKVPVTHRVIEVGPDEGPKTRVLTQGDNNPVPDEPLTLSRIEGRVLWTIPYLGQISRAIGAGGGFYVYHYAMLLLDLVFVLAYVAVSVVQIANRQKTST